MFCDPALGGAAAGLLKSVFQRGQELSNELTDGP
jgi:hypothetical protein